MSNPPTIVLSSGEMSGDIHAARLVERLLQRMPGSRIRALGGDRCRDAGAELLFHYRDYAILGFTGVLTNLVRLWRLERAMKRAIDGADLFVAVDYPGMNLRLAAHARARGVPVLYYISPQVWAWNEKRLHKMRRTVDRMAVIFPFEVAMYEDHGIPVEFVGHPFLVDHDPPAVLPEGQREGIGLLPGSRVGEVERVLPVLLDAARMMQAREPSLRFVIGKSPSVAREVYESALAACGWQDDTPPLDEDAIDVMRRSRMLLVASGTATLQSALMLTPLIVVYKVSAINYHLARRLIKIPDIGLVNVVLGKRVAPEFVQHEAEPARIADAAMELLSPGRVRTAMIEQFGTLRETLAGGEGCRRVAEMAAELVGR